jgi:Fe-S cluster assembly protein SufD
MTQAAARPAPWAGAFAREGASAGPDWLAVRRARAFARFEADGFPRPSDEDWRQTNVGPIASTEFHVARPGAAGQGGPLAEPLGGPRLVFVDGVLAHADLAEAPEGLDVLPLARALAERPDALEPHLAAVAAVERRPFAALNAAFFADGAFVVIRPGAVLERPIQIVYLSAGGERPVAAHPRTLVLAGEGSQATVVETFLGRPPERTLTNAVAELVLERAAILHHVRVVDEGSGWHVASIQATQERDSRLLSHSVCLGAALTRIDLGSRLAGEGAECLLDGLYLTEGRQHVDNHTFLEHAAPHCPSREMYKGILTGDSRAVFNGRILVRAPAQKTDAKQSNRNLLLSGAATVYTRPQLEIYADDVKCTHGATIGRLDEEAMFYLRSRGLDVDRARALLLRAFAAEVLDRVPVRGMRDRLEHVVLERLHVAALEGA